MLHKLDELAFVHAERVKTRQQDVKLCLVEGVVAKCGRLEVDSAVKVTRLCEGVSELVEFLDKVCVVVRQLSATYHHNVHLRQSRVESVQTSHLIVGHIMVQEYSIRPWHLDVPDVVFSIVVDTQMIVFDRLKTVERLGCLHVASEVLLKVFRVDRKAELDFASLDEGS